MWFAACATLALAPLQYQITNQGIQVIYPTGRLAVQPRSERIFRIAYTPTQHFSKRPSLAVINTPILRPINTRKDGNLLTIFTKQARVQVDLITGTLALQDGSGKTLLRETPTQARSFVPTMVAGRAALHAEQKFVMPQDQAFYGLGCLQNGLMDYSGTKQTLVQDNTIDVNPMLISTGGYGILWDNPSKTVFDLGDTSQVIGSSSLLTPDHKPGLRAKYYLGRNFERLVTERSEPKIDADWTEGPISGMPKDNYSIVWDGYVKTAAAGTYTFTAETDDGARLTVNGKKIIDDWRDKPMGAAIGQVSLPANSLVPIRMEYYQAGDKAGAHLKWSAPSKGSELKVWSDIAEQIDYNFIVGPEIGDVIKGYRMLTGKAPLFGKWAYGFWQCKERYKSSEDLLGVASEYRKRGIPIDNIVQDWMYWPDKWGTHRFDQSRYPDPAEMIEKLHEDYHMHLMISVWAKFEKGCDNWEELNRQGMLYPAQNDWGGECQFYDAFNADARVIYWRQMRDRLFNLGIDAWWLDATEPEISMSKFREMETAMGPAGRYLNAYSLIDTQGVYQGQRKETNAKRVFILTRSVFTGQQRNAAATWSGDIVGTWDVFRRQVVGGLQFNMAGVPYWCTDIGGFFSAPTTDPAYQELFTRWFQWGTFCPIYRVHGTGDEVKKELWRFGPDIQPALVKYDKLRYRLMPYIYSQAWAITNDDETLMRSLPMDYRADKNTWNIGDQMLFGPAMMISPVLTAKASSRPVYLPNTTRWTDFWTGAQYLGGRTLQSPTPLDITPIHVPAGSIIPMGPAIQYASEKPADPIELRIYPGKDGQFTLYEDEGDSYNYEKGLYATIPISWSQSTKTLTIGAQKGSFPGMTTKRRFDVVLVRPSHGVGLDPCPTPDRKISYEGKSVSVKL